MTNFSVIKPAGILPILVLLILVSCGKSSFLDKKPNSDNVIPNTLGDFQAILDNTSVMSGTPVLGELSADNYMLAYTFWQTLDAKERNAYAWEPDIYGGQGAIGDWNLPYEQVFYANVVLDGLSALTKDSIDNDPDWKALKGAALFLRAYAFYNLAQVFAPAFDAVTASADIGIPIRMSSQIGAVSMRASLQQTYDQILADLYLAKELLPIDIPTSNLNRPSRPAALAMLARVYLSMGAYPKAGLYADSCLQLHKDLNDFNLVTTPSSNNLPFKSANPEVLYQSGFLTASPQILVGLFYPDCVIDSGLYHSYDSNDLRKKVYFRINGNGLPNIKGSYTSTFIPFTGLATDEVWLIRAECRARAGDVPGALADLDSLLSKRWVQGLFVPVAAGSADAALDSILSERRKELPFRGLRWTDLKRLNKEGRNIALTRNLNGTIISLSPNSHLYVLPIPPDVLSLTGMPNNPRP